MMLGMSGQAARRPRPAARYTEIEKWLRERVLNGAPGDPLPSETELAARFKVSRMTARQAVQNLTIDGLVRRQRGSGTFIAPQPMHRHSGALMNFSTDMRRRGKRASSRLLDARLRTPTAADAEALRLDEGSRVVSLSRLRLADDVPMAIENVALPASCAPVLAEDLEQGSLHEALHALGRVPTTAHSWIGARTAGAAEARLLDIAPRSALLVERRIILDGEGVPLEHTESAYVADRYVIDVTFRVGEVEPSSETDATAGAGSGG